MYLFELFDGGEHLIPTPNPKLPIFSAEPPMNTIIKLGLTGEPMAGVPQNFLTWDTVCNTIIATPNALYREVRPIIANAPMINNAVAFAIDALANRKYAEYRAMRKTMTIDYNPLENYNMTETTTTTYNGGQTVNNSQTTDTTASHIEDAATDSTEYGATKTTTTVGAATDSTKTPQTLTSTKHGATSGTAKVAAATTTEETAHDVYGYNSPATAQAESKDTRTLTAPEQQTTTTAAEFTDTVTTNEITVTNNIGGRNATAADDKHTDTTTRGQRSTNDTYRAGDTTTETTFNNRSDVTEVSRSGNIGVTTSQQLLMSEMQLRRATEYINTLANDVINALTVGVYGLGGL